jgi:uncharacterized protein YlzI (FlbEa/FlbD family)
MDAAILALLSLLELHGLDGRTVYVNPQQIVSMARPKDDRTFHSGVQCVITLADGKFVSVVETCDEVQARMRARE